MHKKMKIAICCSTTPTCHVGGISVYAKELAQALKTLGHAIYYISPEPEDLDWISAWTDGHYWTEPCDDPGESAIGLLSFFRSMDIDGVINNDNPIAQSIAPALSCPFISVGHLDQFSIATLVTHNLNKTDYLVCISSDMQLNFIRRHKVAPEKCVLILNGISDHDTSSNPLGVDSSPRPLAAIYAGGHNRRKGSQHILGLSRRLGATAKYAIHWFGPAPKRASVNSKGAIRFSDGLPRNEYLNKLAQADVLLLPSQAEGCPMSVLEAMCYGLVPIVSDGIGAMRWIVDHGINGFVCPLDGWDGHAARCLEYLERNPAILQDMKKRARQKYLDHFQIERVADDMIRLLNQPVIDRSSPARRLKIVDWHRPVCGKAIPLFVAKIRWKLGILKFSGTVDLG